MVYPACRFAHAGYLLVIVAVVVGAFSLGYSVHDYIPSKTPVVQTTNK
jgi:hypothetical protein